MSNAHEHDEEFAGMSYDELRYFLYKGLRAQYPDLTLRQAQRQASATLKALHEADYQRGYQEAAERLGPEIRCDYDCDGCHREES